MRKEYQSKTDRNIQWELLERSDREDGRPLEYIQRDRQFFFEGIGGSLESGGDVKRLLALWPNRAIEGWQQCILKCCQNPLSISQVFGLEAGIMTGFSGYSQHPEDDAYYVRSLYGEVWSPNATIQLDLPTQEPIKPLSADVAFACGGATLVCWIDEVEGEKTRGGYMRFMPEFFRALIPYVDKRVFDLNKYPFREKVSSDAPVSLSQMKSILKSLILSSHKPETGNRFHDERISVSKQFFRMLEDVKQELGDYSVFVEKTLAEADKS